MFVTPGIIPCLRWSGHLGIQDGIPSDHVGCWLEFDGTELFRGATENLGTIQQKPFTMRDTEQLKMFTEKMETHLTSKRVEQRLEAFQKGLTEGNLALRTEVTEYERIARDVNDATRCGIKAARRHKTGYHRSPALTEAAEIVCYWRIHLQAFRNSLGLSDKTKRYASTNDLPLEILQENEILLAVRASWKDLRAVQQSAREHRSKWLHERADALTSQMKTDLSKAVHQIAAENATKSKFRRICHISKGTQFRATTRVKVPVHTCSASFIAW